MLVGRAAECARIEQLLADARAGSSRTLVFQGEPGIGKSVLLQYAAEQAEGLVVLSVHGVESEADIPFSGLLELVRPALPFLDRIPPRQAAALRGALALGPADRADRFVIGAATLSLLAARAEEAPLLLVVDDAHWLDGSSADAIAFAIRRLVADPIAVLLAVRTGEASAFNTTALPRLTLGGLDRDDANILLVRHAGRAIPRDTADWLYAATGGNPLALVELAADAPRLRADIFDRPLAIGPRVEQAFLRQIERLPDELRRALLIAAACDSGDLKAIVPAMEAVGIPRRALEHVESAGLVYLRSGSLEFRHPLIRSAADHGAPALARRDAHRDLAAVLTSALDVDRRAWHLATAALGPDDEIAAALEDAARRALERSAYAAAASAFERSAQLTAGDDMCARRLQSAADAAWLAGATERCRTLLNEARGRAQDHGLRAEVEQLRGRVAMRMEHILVSHDILKAAATSIEATDPGKAAVLLAEAASALLYSGLASRMVATARRARELALTADDDEAKFFATMALGQALMLSGVDADGADLVRVAVGMMEVSDALWRNPRLVAWAARGRLFLREGTTGEGLMRRAIEAARAHAALGMLPVALSQLALDSAASDRWAAAQAEYAEGIRLARETGQLNELCANLAGLSRLEARMGRADECRAHVCEALELTERFGLGLFRTWVYLALTSLELGLGHPDEAIRQGQAAESVLGSLGVQDVDLSPAPELVEAYLHVGNAGIAQTVCDAYVRRAVDKGLPWALARAERCLGLVADSAWESHFASALDLHARSSDSFERGRTQLCFGERLRRARRRVEARRELRAAFETFDHLGARPWAERARVELLATGETVQRHDVSSLEHLTPQEFQIAQMLAAGATTRETAARLFLSPKTVEYHLKSVYDKLGVRTRSSLTQAMSTSSVAVGATTGRTAG